MEHRAMPPRKKTVPVSIYLLNARLERQQRRLEIAEVKRRRKTSLQPAAAPPRDGDPVLRALSEIRREIAALRNELRKALSSARR
jgi:phytoene/squalene synthetase